MSKEVVALWDRVEAGDPNVEQVTMGEGKAIEVSPTDQEKIIWTYGLSGCYGCLVFTESPDGTRNAIFTHYPPTNVYDNLHALRRLIDENAKMREAAIKQVVLFMPGEWVKDPETGKYLFVVRNKEDADLLTLSLQTELGDIDVKAELYSTVIEIGKKDQGIVVVYIPPPEKGKAHYRTWFSGGMLGKEEEEK